MKIAFIGLGNMGAGMAARQVDGGRAVTAFDLSQAAVSKVVEGGATGASSTEEAVRDVDAVITMLPAGQHVRDVYANQILPNAPNSALLIDCSTVDVESSRVVAAQAKAAGFRFADAPVSGGTAAAVKGTLTFMVGCEESSFPAVEEALAPMAQTVIRAGENGAGQAAKICNNMLLGVSMIATCEAFGLAEKLGLAPDRFFEIASRSSGNCWSLSSYAPWPGVGPESASDRNYEGGFATAMMLKDLKLAQEASARAGATTPMGNNAESIYALFDRLGYGRKDFSGVLQMLRGELDAI